jgi:hypothetical protein
MRIKTLTNKKRSRECREINNKMYEKCFLIECSCEADRLQVLKDDEDARNSGLIQIDGRWNKGEKVKAMIYKSR